MCSRETRPKSKKRRSTTEDAFCLVPRFLPTRVPKDGTGNQREDVLYPRADLLKTPVRGRWGWLSEDTKLRESRKNRDKYINTEMNENRLKSKMRIYHEPKYGHIDTLVDSD